MSIQKLYNPKAHAPAIYIPAWLLQVSTKLISNDAKMVYGRLCQWSNESCQVHRSAPELAQELGMPIRTIERKLKELRDVKLIRTFQQQAGGKNHFEFLHHEWMDVEIKKQLVYKSNSKKMRNSESPPVKCGGTPPSNVAVPPPSNVADINKKEIKRNSAVKNPTNTTHDLEVLNLFRERNIPVPKKITPYIRKIIKKARDQLEIYDFTIESYLNYLINECEQWVYEPHNNRVNDFFVILRSLNIEKGCKGNFEDRLCQ